MIKRYFSKIYTGLVNRLTELESVSNLSMISHLPPPRKHKLSGEYKDYWSVDVSKNQRLLFSSYNSGITNEVDITKIIIEGIEDYH
jgi:proteic killer suppression protein